MGACGSRLKSMGSDSEPVTRQATNDEYRRRKCKGCGSNTRCIDCTSDRCPCRAPVPVGLFFGLLQSATLPKALANGGVSIAKTELVKNSAGIPKGLLPRRPANGRP